MNKIFLLVSWLLISGAANAMDSDTGSAGEVGVRARSESVAANALIKKAGEHDPRDNNPAQDRARITSCLKVLGAGAVVLTGAALIEYWRVQSTCHADSLSN